MRLRVYYLKTEDDAGLKYIGGQLFFRKVVKSHPTSRRYETLTEFTHFFRRAEALAFSKRVNEEKGFDLNLVIGQFNIQVVE